MRVSTGAAALALLGAIWLGTCSYAAQDESKEGTWEGSLVFGTQVLAGQHDSSKFEEYRDVPSGPWLDLLHIERDDTDAGRYISFEAIHPGLTDARAVLRIGEYGTYKGEIYWDKTPHLLSTTARTIYTEASPGVLVLPDAVQQAFQSIATTDINPGQSGTQIDTAAFGALVDDLARPIPLRVDRETLAVSYQRDLNERSSYSVGLSNEHRTGDMAIGTDFGFGTNQIELPAPVDDTTRDVNADIEYRGGSGVARLGYWGSFYDDQLSALRWDNTIAATDSTSASSRSQLALPPSNRASTVTLSGALDFSRGTRLTGALSTGQWTQNDALLPNTINTAIPSPALPTDSAEAVIKTKLAEAVLTSRPTSGLSLTARYRQRTVNNRTPEWVFDEWVLNDRSPETEPAEVEPISFEVRNASVDAGWEMNSNLSLSVGAGRETWHRTHRDVSKTDEDTVRTSLDYRPSESLLARVSFQHSSREIDGAYVPDEAQLPELRKYSEADRDRDALAFLLDLSPSDRWSATVTFNLANDDYDNSAFGLLDDRAYDVSLDGAYSLGESGSLFAGLSFERYRYNMESRYRTVSGGVVVDDPLNDWNSLNTDKVRTVWLGWNQSTIPNRLVWDASLSYSNGVGEIDTTGVPGGAAQSEPVPFPDVHYTLLTLGTGASYRVASERWVRFAYRYEKYDETDFATDVMQPYMGTFDPSSSTSVYLGARQPDYTAHFFTLSLQQKF